MFWLGHVLDAAAYSALPARSVRDAARLITQLNVEVDVLVVNLALPGSPDYISALQRSQSKLKVIGVLSDPAQAATIPRVNAVHVKRPVLNGITKVEWLQCVHGVLADQG